MKHYQKHFIELELPDHIDLEEIKVCLEDQLIMIVKQTELNDGTIRWHIAEID